MRNPGRFLLNIWLGDGRLGEDDTANVLNGLCGEEERTKMSEAILKPSGQTLRPAQFDLNERYDSVDTAAGHI